MARPNFPWADCPAGFTAADAAAHARRAVRRLVADARLHAQNAEEAGRDEAAAVAAAEDSIAANAVNAVETLTAAGGTVIGVGAAGSHVTLLTGTRGDGCMWSAEVNVDRRPARVEVEVSVTNGRWEWTDWFDLPGDFSSLQTTCRTLTPNATPGMLAAATSSHSAPFAYSHPNAPADLVRMALSPRTGLDRHDRQLYINCRAAVAANPNVPQQIASALAGDADAEVRQALARNDNAPHAVLTALAKDSDWSVSVDVARNAATTPDILQVLADDERATVRGEAAANPRTPARSLATLAQDSRSTTRATVAAHPSVPRNVLAHLAGDPAENVRVAVAGNPRTPPLTFELLSSDPSAAVRAAVAANPAAEDHVRAFAAV